MEGDFKGKTDNNIELNDFQVVSENGHSKLDAEFEVLAEGDAEERKSGPPPPILLTEQEQEAYKICERTPENSEFALQNSAGHMSCFLNCALQVIFNLLWTTDRQSLNEFTQIPQD